MSFNNSHYGRVLLNMSLDNVDVVKSSKRFNNTKWKTHFKTKLQKRPAVSRLRETMA